MAIIARQYSPSGAILISIDFEKKEDWTAALLSELTEISPIKGLSLIALVDRIWETAIWHQIMQQAVDKQILTMSDRMAVKTYLSKGKHSLSGDVFKIMLAALRVLGSLLAKNSGTELNAITGALQLTIQGVEIVSHFPACSSTYLKSKLLCIKSLHAREMQVRIVVDSIDKWLPAQGHSLGYIAYEKLADMTRGLIRALPRVYRDCGGSADFTKEATLPNSVNCVDQNNRTGIEKWRLTQAPVVIKAFLPFDLKPIVLARDVEHDLHYHHTIKWQALGLARLVALRILTKRTAYRINEPNEILASSWYQIFPKEVKNVKTKVAHNSFDYVLRHSHLRPREILLFGRLAAEYCRSNRIQSISSKNMVVLVNKHSRNLFDLMNKEYSYAYPELPSLMQRMKKTTNIISGEALRARIGGVKLPSWVSDINGLIDYLYQVGIIGTKRIVKKSEEMKWRGWPRTVVDNELYIWEFIFNTGEKSVSAEPEFTIHPVFYDENVLDCDICSNVTVAEQVL